MNPVKTGFILLPVVLACLWSQSSPGVSFRWGYELPLERQDLYRLEVSRSPGFEDVLLTQLVRGGGYSWNSPTEGVFYWRLHRAGSEGGSESSIVADGLLIGMDPLGKPESQAVDLEWDPWPHADAYLLLLNPGSGGPAPREMTTGEPKVRLIRETFEQSIVIAPIMSGREVFNVYRRWTKVRWVSPLAGPTAAASGEPLPPAPVDAPPAAPEPVPNAVATAIPEAVADEDADLVFGIVGVGVSWNRDDIRVGKLDVTIASRSESVGYAGYLRQELKHGLWLDLDGRYFESAGEEGYVNSYGNDQAMTYDAARYLIQGGLGWNPFFLTGFPYFSAGLRIVGSVRQLPRMPFEMRGRENEPVTLMNQSLPMLGGGLFARISAGDFFSSFLGHYQVGSNDQNESIGGDLLLAWRARSGLHLGVGFSADVTRFDQCHDVRLVCLAEGRVVSELETVQTFFSIGGAL